MDPVVDLRDRRGTHSDVNVEGGRGYVFRVYGTPAPQGSKRAVGKGVMIESSKKVGPWREAVVASVLRMGQFEMMTGAIIAHLLFVMPRPKYHFTAKGELRPNAPTAVTTKPDADKLTRSTFDALTQSGLIKDDSLIWWYSARKEYVGVGEAPGAYVYVSEKFA